MTQIASRSFAAVAAIVIAISSLAAVTSVPVQPTAAAIVLA